MVRGKRLKGFGHLLIPVGSVLKPHVGTIGVSKGADITLSMATYIPEVKAAVWINGCNANVQSHLILRDGILPGLEFDVARTKIENDVIDCIEVLENPADYPETIIPIEKADAHFCFLVGCDDRNWKSEFHADLATSRLRGAGKNNFE
ncbi:Acyl-coenzyme A thioesterase, partial [Halocaridina rubra]